jgi:feruloyl-CoA synthase
VLQTLAAKSTGSATLVRRAVIANFVLSADKGELTDKGSINQRMVLQHYSAVVVQLHAQIKQAEVVESSNNV